MSDDDETDIDTEPDGLDVREWLAWETGSRGRVVGGLAWEAQLTAYRPRPASDAPAARYAVVARARCPVCGRPSRWHADAGRGPVARHCSDRCQRVAADRAWERARPRRTVAARRRVYLERRGQAAWW